MLKSMSKNMSFSGSSMDAKGNETLASFTASYSMDSININIGVDAKTYNDNKEIIDKDFADFRDEVINAVNK